MRTISAPFIPRSTPLVGTRQYALLERENALPRNWSLYDGHQRRLRPRHMAREAPGSGDGGHLRFYNLARTRPIPAGAGPVSFIANAWFGSENVAFLKELRTYFPKGSSSGIPGRVEKRGRAGARARLRPPVSAARAGVHQASARSGRANGFPPAYSEIVGRILCVSLYAPKARWVTRVVASPTQKAVAKTTSRSTWSSAEGTRLLHIAKSTWTLKQPDHEPGIFLTSRLQHDNLLVQGGRWNRHLPQRDRCAAANIGSRGGRALVAPVIGRERGSGQALRPWTSVRFRADRHTAVPGSDINALTASDRGHVPCSANPVAPVWLSSRRPWSSSGELNPRREVMVSFPAFRQNYGPRQRACAIAAQELSVIWCSGLWSEDDQIRGTP